MAAFVEAAGLRTLSVNKAYQGDSFVMVDTARVAIRITLVEAADLAKFGRKLTDTANWQLCFSYNTNANWKHFSFCQSRKPFGRKSGCVVNEICCAH